MTRKEFEIITPEVIDRMSREQLQVVLDDSLREYKRNALRKDILFMLDSLVTTDELMAAKQAVEEIYQKHLANWGDVFGLRDNLIMLANSLTDDMHFEELKLISDYAFWTTMELLPEYISEIPYITQHDLQVLATKGDIKVEEDIKDED